MPSARTIIVAEADPENRRWLVDALAGCEVQVVDRGAQALEALADGAKVLIAGTCLGDMGQVELIQAVAAQGKGAVLVVGDASPEVFYGLPPKLPAESVRQLVQSALTRAQTVRPQARSPQEAAQTQKILEIARRLAGEKELSGVARVAAGATIELVDAVRVHCLFYDASTGALWAEGEESGRTASSGIAGFAARTGQAVAVDQARHDPRWAATIDDPAGSGEERLFVQPVAGPGGEIHAVLVAVREKDQPGFSAADAHILQALAEQCGPILHQVALGTEAQTILEEQNPLSQDRDLFRREAIKAYAEAGHRGDLIRVSPVWMAHVFWLLVALVIGGGAYLALGRVHTYAQGSAVVRQVGRTEVTARTSGTVVSVAVTPGDRVVPGQVLVHFYDAAQLADLEEAEQVFETHLIARLRDPADPAARDNVALALGRKQRVEAALGELAVRAPRQGTVSDVRVRPNMHVAPGDVLCALAPAGEEDELVLWALLPGSERARLRAGQRIRFELLGEREVHADLVMESVEESVIGPAEVRRILGADIGDSLQASGPVVLAKARLPSATFTVNGTTYRYHDGMPGHAEVETGSEPLLVTLVPGLKGW